jgi:hypothetical protein
VVLAVVGTIIFLFRVYQFTVISKRF